MKVGMDDTLPYFFSMYKMIHVSNTVRPKIGGRLTHGSHLLILVS